MLIWFSIKSYAVCAKSEFDGNQFGDARFFSIVFMQIVFEYFGKKLLRADRWLLFENVPLFVSKRVAERRSCRIFSRTRPLQKFVRFYVFCFFFFLCYTTINNSLNKIFIRTSILQQKVLIQENQRALFTDADHKSKRLSISFSAIWICGWFQFFFFFFVLFICDKRTNSVVFEDFISNINREKMRPTNV